MRAAGGPEDFRVIGTPARDRAIPALFAGPGARLPGRSSPGLKRAQAYPRPQCRQPLQIALTRLAKHYGLIGSETQKPARRGLRHWGSEDYRPTLDAWRSGARSEGES